MPDLFHSLQGRDLGHLRIVAACWGVELQAPDANTALPELVSALLEPNLANELSQATPAEAQQALSALVESDGRMPWAIFTRRFGSIREMGPGRRDRERPYLSPVSPAEILWYRALVSRAFLKTDGEPQEFAYIPDEFLQQLPAVRATQSAPEGLPAALDECANPIPVNDRILDHACTLLAALRLGKTGSQVSLRDSPAWEMPPAALQSLLLAAGLIDADGAAHPEPIRAFLEAPRGAAISMLFHAWRSSPVFNELRLLPNLSCEGEWRNDPLKARLAIIDLLLRIPPRTWWSLPAFVAGVHQHHPDFQRPAGDYDSWFIRSKVTSEYLRGVGYWEEIDGALIRYMVCGPLHWLGIFELATPETGTPSSAFRSSPWAQDLLQGKAPGGLPEENAPLQVTSDGHLKLTSLTPRPVRYQVARFCEWGGETQDEYRYHITPAALEQARSQGLRPSHLVGLLRRHATNPPTPVLVQALERWDEQGTQATLEKVTILRVASPEILASLRRSPAARFLGDPLSATSIVVKENAAVKVMAALAQMGYLTDVRLES
jgi:hypothetical protein